MAEKMDKQPAPPLSVSVDKKKKQQALAAPPVPAVTLVSLWALINACVPTLALALTFTLRAYNVYSKLPSWLYQRVELTDEEGASWAIAFEIGYLWCSVPQAAAAALALLLAGRRRRIRRALAYLALAATAADHCLFAGILGFILAADPEYLLMWIAGVAVIFVFELGDLFCFLDMLHGEE
ncbi:unnamed protein product [Urochloa humidicola]